MLAALRPLVLASLVLSGCNRAEPCVVVIDRSIECSSSEDRPLRELLKDAHVKECRERGATGEEDVAGELECARLPSCEEHSRCLHGIADRQLARQVKRDVAAAGESDEKRLEAVLSCELYQGEDAEVLGLCRDLSARAVEAEIREVAAIRDRGGEAGGRCDYLMRMAGSVSPEQKAKAEALCKEAEVGQRAWQAIDQAKRNLVGGTLEVPFQCAMAVDELAALGSDWAKGKLQEVLRDCYLELGKRILPARIEADSDCEFQVALVYEAVKKYGLKDAALDPWIAKADTSCAQE